jgi:nucleoside-diphosphate-sugar epimerase
LIKNGDRVRALVRQSSKIDALCDLPVEIVYGDLAINESLDPSIMDGIEIVYHVAAAYRAENVPQGYFWNVNVKGTKRLLMYAKRSGVNRFVHCSTVGVQGEIKHPPATEEHPYNPSDDYQRSKVEGEKLALVFFKNEGLPGIVVRPVGIYGPGDTRFLKLFKFINDGKFHMIGSGKVLYHLTYVTDLVAGILLAGEHPNALGQVFTIGGDEYVTLNELVAKIANILNRKISKIRIPVWPVWFAGWLCEWTYKTLKKEPPLYRRRVDFFIKDRAFDISKAKNLLGYVPKVDLDKGLKQTAKWYADRSLL